MKKFLINTHFIEDGFSNLINICQECNAEYQMSVIRNWLFEVSVPESDAEKFRELINCVKISDLVNYPTN